MRFVSCALVVCACGSRTSLDAPAPIDMPPACGDDAFVSATLRITADDEYRAWVNGVLVDDIARKWWEVRTLVVKLRQSQTVRNTLALEVTNRWSQDGIDRGVIADLVLPNGAHLVTSSTWRLSSVLVSGWEIPNFDASSWKPAFSQGANGIAPYGALLGDSTAEWLWSRSTDVPESQKPTLETIWLRRDFWIDSWGQIREAPCR